MPVGFFAVRNRMRQANSYRKPNNSAIKNRRAINTLINAALRKELRNRQHSNKLYIMEKLAKFYQTYGKTENYIALHNKTKKLSLVKKY